MDNNVGGFLILAGGDIEALSRLDIDEALTLIFEDLEPSRVGAPDLHVS